MKTSLLLLILLSTGLSTITSAQDAPEDQSQITPFDICADYAINYAFFVAVAHNTKDEKTFNEFIEKQIESQPNPDAIPLIRHFAEQAWRDRNLPPTVAGIEVFQQCERKLIESAQKHEHNSSLTI